MHASEAASAGLTDEQREIRDSAAALARTFDADYWLERDEKGLYPWELVRAFAARDWLGIAIPEEYGGSGLGVTEGALLLREVAASGAGLSGAAALHHYVFPAAPIVKHGSEEMKQANLPLVARGDLLIAFGVTEPNAGTDTSRIETRAVRQDDGRWLINGQKVWLTQGLEAHKVLLLVRTRPRSEEKPFRGLTLFLCDLDRERVALSRIDKLGRAAVDSTEAFITDLEATDADVVGEEGRGFYHILEGLNAERIVVALEAVGLGEAALRLAVDYARERVVFNRPIGANQSISHPLADSWARLRAAELLTLEAARLHDAGQPCGEEATAAKYLAADASFTACDRAVQTHGGFGYAKEYHVERLWRESRLYRLAPISQEMALNHVAQQTLRLPRSY